jgi:hypothetical protein
MTTLRRLPLLLLALLAFPSAVFAHRLDEYLQATLVAIEPGDVRLQINLMPGVAIAEQVLALIDRDRDGMVSTNESVAYAELLKRDLLVRLDERNVELKLTASNFPAPAELRTGFGIIQLEFSAKPRFMAAGAHRLTLENRHLSTVSVYLINAAKPKLGTIQITGQNRNKNQSAGEIEFSFQPPPANDSSRAAGIFASLAALLLVAVCTRVWRTRQSSPRSTCVLESVSTGI